MVPDSPYPIPSGSTGRISAFEGVLHPQWRYHLLGIGGMGMSALAEVMHRRGFSVCGSDTEEGAVSVRLRGLGIEVKTGHKAEDLDGMDAVIYSPALRKEHPIWDGVKTRGLPAVSRSAALGALSIPFRTLAVTGTHGKTTSTAALGQALTALGWDPTVLAGGQVAQFGGGNARVGASDWMVVEADESDGGFTALAPEGVLLTNIEAEHLDHHGDLEHMTASFRAFIQRLAREGVLVYCGDDPMAATVAAEFPGAKISYGTSPGVALRVSIDPGKDEEMRVCLEEKGGRWEFGTPLMGRHNALNLAGVFALARAVGAPEGELLKGLSGFGGVARRQQYLGRVGNCRIYDDYAHHPTEVAATLAAFLERFGEPVTVVFQPHLYSRTAFFGAEFAKALSRASQVYVTDIYGSREKPIPGVSSRLILDELRHHPHAHALPDWREAAHWREPPKGILISMGAGDITGLGRLLLGKDGAP